MKGMKKEHVVLLSPQTVLRGQSRGSHAGNLVLYQFEALHSSPCSHIQCELNSTAYSLKFQCLTLYRCVVYILKSFEAIKDCWPSTPRHKSHKIWNFCLHFRALWLFFTSSQPTLTHWSTTSALLSGRFTAWLPCLSSSCASPGSTSTDQ